MLWEERFDCRTKKRRFSRIIFSRDSRSINTLDRNIRLSDYFDKYILIVVLDDNNFLFLTINSYDNDYHENYEMQLSNS